MKALGKILLLLAVFLCVACEKPVIDEDTADVTVPDGSPSENTKKFTFTLKGDFSDTWKPVTRTVGYLQADGRDMTDIWVLDYQNGKLVQQIHQSDNTADDFGKPVLNLVYGSHHVYFIASRGTGAMLNTDAHTITFGKTYDTFYKDYEVTVVNTSNGNRAVTLDRIITKLRLKFTDAISADAATFNITPSKWYYGWDYVAGTPTDARTSQEVSITIPDGEKGNTDVLVNVFGFSTATEWQASVTFNAKRADGSVIGQATIEQVPFKANRITEYAGRLFSSDGEQVALSLNGDWNETYHGLW
jgi:hypothetical protein